MNLAFYSKMNEAHFNRAENRNDTLLIGYLIAMDPNPDHSLEIIKESVEAGIDIIELGVPSLNPYLDGEIIKRGHNRVMQHGDIDQHQLLSYWGLVREQVKVPIWAMGYQVDIVDSELYRLLFELRLIDGLVLPDCSLQDQLKLHQEASIYGVDVIRLVNNQMDEATLQQACQGAKIIYAQAYSGATGNPFAQIQNLDDLCRRIRRHAEDSKIVAGFGLRSPERVKRVVQSGFDGAVVGSVLVSRCENKEQDYLYRLIAEMKLTTVKGGED